MKRKGVSVAEVRADVKPGTRTHALCTQFGLHKSATFQISTYSQDSGHACSATSGCTD